MLNAVADIRQPADYADFSVEHGLRLHRREINLLCRVGRHTSDRTERAATDVLPPAKSRSVSVWSGGGGLRVWSSRMPARARNHATEVTCSISACLVEDYGTCPWATAKSVHRQLPKPAYRRNTAGHTSPTGEVGDRDYLKVEVVAPPARDHGFTSPAGIHRIWRAAWSGEQREAGQTPIKGLGCVKQRGEAFAPAWLLPDWNRWALAVCFFTAQNGEFAQFRKPVKW